MLETSRWVLHVNNPFMKKDLTAQINVSEDGSFEFYAVTPEGLKPLPKEAKDKLTVKDNTISAEITSDEMKGMKIEIAITFGDEKAEGYFKVPIFGKMKFGGERIEIDDLPIIESKKEEAAE